MGAKTFNFVSHGLRKLFQHLGINVDVAICQYPISGLLLLLFLGCRNYLESILAELIVKYRCTEKLSFVGRFLKYHQSMGIYLYGEMKISKSKHIKSYAVQIFKELQNEMDPTMAVNVKEILFSN